MFRSLFEQDVLYLWDRGYIMATTHGVILLEVVSILENDTGDADG